MANRDEYTRFTQDLRSTVTWYMQEHDVSRAELARRMKVTPGRVSQMLSGDENLTIRTLSSIARCLGARWDLELVPIDASRISPSAAG
jgi:transcriptional regulator with XRE-family HTH domain